MGTREPGSVAHPDGFEWLGTRDIEVRVDAFNAFNWFQWGQPATALNNLATFGQITTADTRAMQFAIGYGSSGIHDSQFTIGESLLNVNCEL